MRGVLFDAGGVLIRPVGGRWNPRRDFEGIVARHHPSRSVSPEVIAAGQHFLDSSPRTASRDAYHRVMLAAMGIDDPSPDLLHELDTPAAGPFVELYPDVLPVLDELSARGIRMSVVSDTWAGMAATFDELGLGHYFAGYAISEVLGCRKPDPRMYAEGARLIALEPHDCLFIDDDPDLVAAARALGYHGLTLDRPAMTLDALLPLLA
ncbi:HAD family hydrolase [Actinoplanes sp. NPDC051343]|uniref:HAD family hydrolase n=1 Tax=Actinoplanes sp. NPDC051343 TaxID=3363906 RepID=UPI003799A8D6